MKTTKTKFKIGSFPFAFCLFLLTANCQLPTFSFAQSLQVQNAKMYLGEKQYDKAKLNTDASVTDDKTKNLPKAWLYRGQIYQAIYQDTNRKVYQLDPDAREKAVESFVRCLQLDKDSIYKKDAKNGLAISASALLNRVEKYYLPSKLFDKASAACEILKTALPFDFDESMKRSNITAGNIMYIQFRTYYAAADMTKAKEVGNKLIDTHFKMPAIYVTMVKLALGQQDTSSALSYLDKGLAIFDDNMDLITLQINILMMQKKADLVKQKLENALEISPNSDGLHAALASLYEKSNDLEKAEKEYQKAIELNRKYEDALFNLGNLYFNQGTDWNKKANNLPPKETAKAKEYEKKSEDFYKKAIVPFEQYFQIKPDAAVKQRLRQIYTRLRDTEKANQYK